MKEMVPKFKLGLVWLSSLSGSFQRDDCLCQHQLLLQLSRPNKVQPTEEPNRNVKEVFIIVIIHLLGILHVCTDSCKGISLSMTFFDRCTDGLELQRYRGRRLEAGDEHDEER